MMMLLKGIGFVILGIGLFLVATYVVMRLWNWLIPDLFKGPKLRFVQALGLFFLIRLLVGFGGPAHGGFGHGGRFSDWRHRSGWHQPYDRSADVDHPQRKPVTPAQ